MMKIIKGFMRFKSKIKKISWVGVLILLCVPIYISCVSIPKSTVDLSIQLEQQLQALKRANEIIIGNVYSEKESRIVDYVDNVWYPQYLKELYKNEVVVKLWEQVLETDTVENRMQLLLSLTQISMQEYNEYKTSLIAPIEEERKMMLANFNKQFDIAILMNGTIQKNISSAKSLEEEYQNYLSTVVSIDKLDSITKIAVEETDKQLDNIQSGINKYDQIKDKVVPLINTNK